MRLRGIVTVMEARSGDTLRDKFKASSEPSLQGPSAPIVAVCIIQLLSAWYSQYPAFKSFQQFLYIKYNKENLL